MAKIGFRVIKVGLGEFLKFSLITVISLPQIIKTAFCCCCLKDFSSVSSLGIRSKHTLKENPEIRSRREFAEYIFSPLIPSWFPCCIQSSQKTVHRFMTEIVVKKVGVFLVFRSPYLRWKKVVGNWEILHKINHFEHFPTGKASFCLCNGHVAIEIPLATFFINFLVTKSFEIVKHMSNLSWAFRVDNQKNTFFRQFLLKFGVILVLMVLKLVQ